MCSRRPWRRPAGRRRQLARRDRRAGGRRWPSGMRRACPASAGGRPASAGVPGGPRLGARARLRRPGGDGRRPVARSRASRRDAGRDSNRRPGHRQPVRARRRHRATGRGTAVLLSAGGNRYVRLVTGDAGRTTPPRGFRAFRRAVLEEIDLRDAAVGRLQLPARDACCRRGGRASGSTRCRSPSSSARRCQQDQPRDRCRGALAGAAVGAAGPAGPQRSPSALAWPRSLTGPRRGR